MKDFYTEARLLIERLFREGRPGDARKELRRLARKMGINENGLRKAERMIKLVQQKLNNEFLLKYTKGFILGEYEKINTGFEEGVLRVVRQAMKSGQPGDVVKALRRLGKTARRHLGTVAQTAKDGLAQGQKIEDAKKAGVKYFRYTGPAAGARPRCGEWLGKIYSINEIDHLDNGQGLPVLYYMGGWNCRHRWVSWQGRLEGGVYIHSSYEAKRANKQDRQTLKNELKGARLLAKHGQVEINPHRADQEAKDTDLYYEGKPAQLKQTKSTKPYILRELLRKSRHQADNVVVIAANKLEDEKKSLESAKDWLDIHTNKNLIFLNYKNKIQEVKHE